MTAPQTDPPGLRWRLSNAHGRVLMFGEDRWLDAENDMPGRGRNGWLDGELEALVTLLNDAAAIGELLAPPRFLTVRDPDRGDWLLIDSRPGGSVGRREAQLLARFSAPDVAAMVRATLNEHLPALAPAEEPF